MKRIGSLMVAVALLTTLGLASACQRTVEVQTGTRIVDSQGRVVSEDIKTLRVPPETAGAYRVNTITQEDPPDPQLASLYAEAQTAIANGNLKLAADRLSAVIAISPEYGNAKKQADAIKAGKKVTADKAPAKPTAPTAPTVPTAPTTSTAIPPVKESPSTVKPPVEVSTSLQRWTPDALTGFTAAPAAFDPLSVSREYRPGSGNPARSLVIVAEQFRTSADAKTALSVNVKERYAGNASTFTANGHEVYFGTNGQFAVLGFTDGAQMVALEASPDSESPSTMKATLVKALGQLP